MSNTKQTLFGLLAFILVFGTSLSGQAAEKTAAGQPSDKTPIVVEADKVYFSDMSGDLYAQGSVNITKNQDKILADLVRGNTKRTEVWIDGKATMLQPGTTLNGTGVRYNYNNRTGSIAHANGKVDKDIITGDDINLSPGKIIIVDGTVTRCPAEVPDYHISADKVEIQRGVKMTAYNAKFWIKDKVIFTLPRYEKSLEESTTSAFPSVDYSSENGVSLNQYLEMPLNGDVNAYADIGLYSKQGFRSMIGLVNKEAAYTLNLGYGYELNNDDEWIKKEPEFSFKLKPYRFGNTPLTANLSAATGKWTEDDISGWRQGYDFYLSHDPIKLSKATTLKFGVGAESIHYGYNNTVNDIFKYDIRLASKPNDRLETWAGYSYKGQSSVSPYEYDLIEDPRELSGGFMYKVDKLNSLGIKANYYLEKDQLKDLDYTWRRNLHCFEADVTYRAKREQISVKVSTIEW